MPWWSEVLIVIAAGILCRMYHGLIYCINTPHTQDGIFGVNSAIRRSHYELRKSKFLFFHIFIMNRKWKSGLIYKETFWKQLASDLIIYIFPIVMLLYGLITGRSLLQNSLPYIITFLFTWLVSPYIVNFFFILYRKCKKEE